ncbi:hypothetical protein HETIRDRAFT_421702 [Heterobasidion irregulare TC 32-1]|uniref:Uncharacterized protein n=1 Tax=Heterobasidion irregulare (strain TC 32-1) TaxID=747525 RepID=W4JVM0_HETIT|nr:uncharacterized protein HETIRDRAFT_421702 [Heterobasidion irregulare TC 32-1]ETW77587.1 hypothetical protein HETIRDRAFT_421702 [Heterobasidion irregulare TC 32-1]
MRRFVEAFKARDLRIYYPLSDLTMVLSPFLIYSGLRSIFVEIDMLHLNIPEAFFDFTIISTNVSLEVNARFDVEFKLQIPRVWVNAKRALPSMFVDDSTKFDVHRMNRCGLRVRKPHAKDKEVLRQEHAPDLEAENEEAESMAAHYQRRNRQLLVFRGYRSQSNKSSVLHVTSNCCASLVANRLSQDQYLQCSFPFRISLWQYESLLFSNCRLMAKHQLGIIGISIW